LVFLNVSILYHRMNIRRKHAVYVLLSYENTLVISIFRMYSVKFSNIFNQSKKIIEFENSLIFFFLISRQAYDLVAILEAKRNSLHANGASIEKCLMLNRWITYISEVKIFRNNYSIQVNLFSIKGSRIFYAIN
jgi:hypothetical protein